MTSHALRERSLGRMALAAGLDRRQVEALRRLAACRTLVACRALGEAVDLVVEARARQPVGRHGGFMDQALRVEFAVAQQATALLGLAPADNAVSPTRQAVDLLSPTLLHHANRRTAHTRH